MFGVQLMACIGEHFTDGDDICGVVVNIRGKQDRLSIWTKTASDEAIQVSTASHTKPMQNHALCVNQQHSKTVEQRLWQVFLLRP